MLIYKLLAQPNCLHIELESVREYLNPCRLYHHGNPLMQGAAEFALFDTNQISTVRQQWLLSIFTDCNSILALSSKCFKVK